MFNGLLKSRAVRYGTVSTLITVLVIALLVTLNAALTFLFKKYPLRIDLTRDKVFELSEDTEEFLSGLAADVDVFILNSEPGFSASSPAVYFTQANEVLRRYAQHSSRIRISYVDLLRNPDFASRYPDVSLSVNDILLSSGGRSRVIRAQDLFNIQSSYYGSRVLSSKAEQTMTSALLSLTGVEKTLVSVINGHGEESIAAFLDHLSLNAFEYVTQNLLTEEIQPGVSLVILAAPSRDLSEEELRKLDGFLAGGKNKTVFYLASASQQPLPNLASFLAEWGIAVGEGTAFETDAARLLGNNPYLSIADYGEEEYSKNAAEKGLLPVTVQSRPLTALFEQKLYRTVIPLLRLSPRSGVRPANTVIDWQPSPADLTGDVPVLLLSRSLQTGRSGSLEQTNVLVSGSIFSLDQSILSGPNIANAGYFLDILGNLAGRERSVWVADKTLGFSQLGIAAGHVIVLVLVFMALLPLGTLIFGVVVWLRRRHR
ncbi:MAG: GldG family protein [Treponema sp.]|jgi:hypothetical protein|nr:GldG family protein [Treponema sp.]